MTDSNIEHKLATRCIHAGDTVDATTGAVMPAIATSTIYRQPAFNEPGEHIYARTSNPTRDALERCVAELESGVRGLAFASGMAATANVLELLDAGEHIIAPTSIYGGSLRLFRQVRTRTSALEFSFVDFSDPANVEQAIRPNTRLIWIETPTNPLLNIIDIEATAALARAQNILMAVDNTFATPCVQRPLEAGCDLVMHSTTKYLGGHSDALGGLIVVADEQLGKQLASLRSAVGGVAGPFDAYLVLRGIKTLALRMERHQANAMAVAKWLVDHPQVEQVCYPGLDEHPHHEVATRQMDGYGGVVSFVLRGGLSEVGAFLNALRVFTLAESLGGVESLVGHPATMSHSSLPAEERTELGITDNLIRLSVGIEHVDDLLTDLDRALGR
ncbi:MAG TPA: PLP-dependent aspartate aminotransferase family protein [Gammaproteobacteria bacterium]|jgi:cystathionine gamma-lyase|nr:cystathionine beta-lyase [Chromatiales bacterium]MCP4925688.1 PLP-dependent transferase [Gammaproteobacteria bacterium]MDP7154623.1 PLP-dependent aspartate aminotransferase family protein [Gammaproteobacteria bacterium]MDP7296465.1 PLP-dependent aspartate aminotransferase family protein [Gammaproteobacteria bacterium]MDP7660145.1 PLP-dependent aspartate aminotransferase family protein [Gammaproteobacteria bacterium]